MSQASPPSLQTLLDSSLDELRATRQRTRDILDSLDDGELHRRWPRPGLDTFAKHLYEMASVERAFARSIAEGSMDFSEVPGVFDIPAAVDRTTLFNLAQAADEALVDGVRNARPEAAVDWGEGPPLPLLQHLNHLICHEVFHHGMMAMACYVLGIELPESLRIAWALPKSSPKETR